MGRTHGTDRAYFQPELCTHARSAPIVHSVHRDRVRRASRPLLHARGANGPMCAHLSPGDPAAPLSCARIASHASRTAGDSRGLPLEQIQVFLDEERVLPRRVRQRFGICERHRHERPPPPRSIATGKLPVDTDPQRGEERLHSRLIGQPGLVGHHLGAQSQRLQVHPVEGRKVEDGLGHRTISSAGRGRSP